MEPKDFGIKQGLKKVDRKSVDAVVREREREFQLCCPASDPKPN